ncbi:Solanesyl diphosphate synthase 3 [Citrus sinensis]|nr:Solanesyl diphosphate synthase 3 [Citrus sinensis]
MLFSQLVYRIAARTPRNSLPSCRWILSHRRYGHQPTFRNSNENKKHLDPFSLVGDELSLISMRLRSMVVAEVPELASAAGYFFKEGVEGKKLCPTVILLMATALNVCTPELSPNVLGNTLILDLRRRQQCIAEITEMIHVASLIHDDVLDDADTRRGIGSLSSVMGNKLAILAGDLLISRAFVALASLKHTEVVSLMATALKNLVSGETMQMTATFEQCCSMECYMQKTYNKTAALVSNSCKAVAYLSGQREEVATLAFEYGKNLSYIRTKEQAAVDCKIVYFLNLLPGLAYQLIDDILDFTGTSASLGKASLTDLRNNVYFSDVNHCPAAYTQHSIFTALYFDYVGEDHRGIITAPILFAMEEFPQLRAFINSSSDNPANVDVILEYLGKSHGIQRTTELALKHASLAAAAIDSLPETHDVDATNARTALVHITQKIITRNK